MSLGVRAGKAPGRPAARLLLPRPGGEPAPMVATKWRAVICAPAGDIAPESAVAAIKPAPMAAKAEKALITAMAADDVPALKEIAGAPGDLAPVAMFLVGLRLANTEVVAASSALSSVLDGDSAPWDHKFFRRYLPTLHVCAALAPGVPAILGADQEAAVILLAELLVTQGRHMDALTLIGQQPLTPVTGLALAACNLAIGQMEAVVKLTDGLQNLDDMTALCLVARGVALRTRGRNEEALAAFDAAIHAPNRHPGMVSAALEERAALLRMSGEDLAAQADAERIAALAGGADVDELAPREEIAPLAAPTPVATQTANEEAMAAARSRVRRRIAMAGAPGTFGGRHHRTYLAEVEAMLAAGQFDAVESLMLGLIDAVEDEAEVEGMPIDATFYLTLADLFDHRGDVATARAVMERFESAGRQYGTRSDEDDLAQEVAAMDDMNQQEAGSYSGPPAQAFQPAT